MHSIDWIRHNLDRSAERVLLRIGDMESHCLVPSTPRGGVHTLWVLGHLAYIEGLVIHGFLLGRANPLAGWEEQFDGDAVSPDPSRYPPFAEVLDRCRRVRRETRALLDSLREEDLDRPAARCPEGYEAFFGTYRDGFQFVADHGYMHRGQLACARNMAGVDRMWV